MSFFDSFTGCVGGGQGGNTLLITMSKVGNDVVMDKTFSEILSAISNGGSALAGGNIDGMDGYGQVVYIMTDGSSGELRCMDMAFEASSMNDYPISHIDH